MDNNGNNTSLLYRYGFVSPDSPGGMSTKEYTAAFFDDTSGLSIRTSDNREILDLYIDSKTSVRVNKDFKERFHGFGFQRKTYDANGMILEFRKGYRWNEATVPFFLSSHGYGVFSANTYDHTFNFTDNNQYSISMAGGSLDLYIILGPSFKRIISSYTALTGRPIMIPKWSFGLCYAGRLFESQDGLLEIARRFRSEGIPCDMMGVEPGWEEHYYQMKWEWSKKLFPNPKQMLDELHEMGYAFELWDSGDAPASGFTDEKNRKEWFSQRISSSVSIGVDFFKQDDPYPRCITSEEMVTNPDVSEVIEDDETINIANTLYSETVFNEIRRLTGKRTMIIFHSYASSFSSHRYPAVWAGDFKLGNGAVNASLSGHSMVTQDMRSEVPDGIHFGFLLPYAFMDSWAYYLEPWLFSDHIKEMIKIYSRLRSSLFPYLYTAFRESHETGIPMLRPMILEFQDDPEACRIDDQFMLGENFLVCAAPERGTEIYLPGGCWINYWTGEETMSTGDYFKAQWPVFAGGALYVRKGAIVPKCPALDSLADYGNDILIIESFPEGSSKAHIYEDDGISYDYENGKYAKTPVECNLSGNEFKMTVGKTVGSYQGMPDIRKYIIKVHSILLPANLKINNNSIQEATSIDILFANPSPGWTYDGDSKYIYIKPQSGWRALSNHIDPFSFYGFRTTGTPDNESFDINILLADRLRSSSVKESEEKIQPICSAHFSATVNPPQRVRLNHGDNWLPYYVYVSFEIRDESENVIPVNIPVSLEIITSEGVHTKHSTMTYRGTGHFKRINLADPGVAVSAVLKLHGDGIEPTIIEYNPSEHLN
jgi:alpha-glucosidase (family GH31 glycosyl hydrolase)